MDSPNLSSLRIARPSLLASSRFCSFALANCRSRCSTLRASLVLLITLRSGGEFECSFVIFLFQLLARNKSTSVRFLSLAFLLFWLIPLARCSGGRYRGFPLGNSIRYKPDRCPVSWASINVANCLFSSGDSARKASGTPMDLLALAAQGTLANPLRISDCLLPLYDPFGSTS